MKNCDVCGQHIWLVALGHQPAGMDSVRYCYAPKSFRELQTHKWTALVALLVVDDFGLVTAAGK